ncbi:MAG TPA: MBG domain-containing protein [Pyrinomonadaceae bacterium]|nr:MBG domain-containing protein [Pyrinomonadaceae bacterium]
MLQRNKRLRRLIARKMSQKAAKMSLKGWINQAIVLMMIYSVLMMAVPARGLAAGNQRALNNKNEQTTATRSQETENSQISETKQENRSTDDLAAEPDGQTATELENGDILIVGGSTAKIYFAASNSFGAVNSPLSPRENHAAVRLNDGRVLITGGSQGKNALRSSEIFDPSTGTFSAAAEMNFARNGHTATVLTNGKVLIAGGGNAELYDPSTNTFETIGSAMKTARANHTASLLNDGRILIVGGTNEKGKMLNSAELFDPSINEFIAVSEMANTRKNAVLRVLHDGKVQIIGGSEQPTMELFDPTANRFGANVKIPENGNDFPELFNDIMSSPTRAAVLGKNVIELPQAKKALVYADANGLQNGQIFNSSKATISTEALNYPAGNTVIVTGKGFMPSETVELVFYQTGNSSNKNQPRFTAQTNENGEFRFDGFTAEESNGSLLIDAKGDISGEKAQTTIDNIRTVNSVTLNGGSAVTVAPSTLITVTATVTLDSNSNWNSSGSFITTNPAPPANSNNGSFTCVDHSNHTSFPSATFTETFTIEAPPTVGTYNVYFRFYPNDDCSGSSHTPLNMANAVTVRNASTTTLNSSLNPSAINDEVTFTATVSGSTGTPTGSVEFFDGSSSLGAVALISGIATLSSSALTGGSHTIKAVYSGSSVPSYAPSEATLTQTVDATSPTATVSNAYTTPTNANPIVFAIAFSESVTGADSAAGYTVTNGTVLSVTGSGNSRIVNVTPTADGTVSLQVNAGAAQDAVGNENTVSNISSVIYDATKPTPVVSSAPNPTNTSPITFSVDFGETVTGGDIAGNYTVVNGTIGMISGTGSTRTVLVSPIADGIVSLKVNVNAATDSAGNTSNESNTKEVSYDSTLPSVTVSPLTGLTNASPIVFSVQFSEPVTGFGDVSTDYAVDNGTVSIGGSGQSYTATVTPSGQGAVTFAVNANAAVDGSNNGNTTSATASVTYDSVAPVPTISNGYSSATSTSPVLFTVSFSEPVVSGEFTASDIALSGTANPTSLSVATTDNQTFTVSVKGMNASGTVVLNVAAGAAHDAAGNLSTAAAENSADFDLVTTQKLILPSTAPQPWYYYNEVSNNLIPSDANPGTDFVSTTSIPSHGIGAARVKSLAGEKTLFFTPDYNGSRFDELTEFSFWFKQDASDLVAKTPYVNFGIDFDSTDGITPITYQGRLTYVPQVATTPGTWQKLDLTTGKFYFTSSMVAGSNACRGQSNLCTLQQILTNYPNLNLPNTPYDNPMTPHNDAPFGFGLIGIRVDGDSQGFTSYIDGIVVGKNSSNTDYDFEPAAIVSLTDPSAVYDGNPHGTTATTTPNGLTVNLEYTGVLPTVYAASSTPPTDAGTYSVTGTINDPVYVGSATLSFTISKASQTITFAPPTTPAAYNSTFTVAPTSSSSLAVSVAASGGCSISSGTVTMTSGTTTCVLTASQAGDNNYNAATDVIHEVNASKINQTITFAPPATPAAFNSTFTVEPMSDSNLTVDVAATGGCSISGLTVTMTSGTTVCTLTASQGGDNNYNPATNVVHEVSASKINQTITFAQPPSPAAYNSSFMVAPTSNSNLAVSVVASGGCSISSGTVTMTSGTTTCVLTASQAGDNNYNAASNVIREVAASKLSQTIEFEQPASPATFGTSFTVAPTSDSMLTVSVSASGGCEISGDTVTMTSGTNACVLTASQTGNDNYETADPVVRTVGALLASQTIDFTQPTDKTYGDGDFSLTATASSNLAVSFASNSTSVCTVSGSSVHIVSAGTCSITASQAGNGDWASAESVTKTLSIAKGSLTVTANNQPITFGDSDPSPFTFSYSGFVNGEGDSVIDTPPTCGVSSSHSDAGTYPIVCSGGADNNYSFSYVDGTLTVSAAPTTTTVSVTGGVYNGNPFVATAVVTGAGGLNQSVSPITYTGRNLTVYNSTTPPTNVGDYTASASFAGGGNYVGSNGSADFSITKATPTVVVTGGTFEYDGNPHSATGTVTGVNSEDLGTLTFTYTPGGSSAPVNVGAYSVSGSFAGNDNYNPASGTAEITITAAPATVTVTFEAGPYVYRGTPFTATARATGAGGLDVDVTASIVYTDCTNVGTCRATATFSDANHAEATNFAEISITQATPTVTVSGGSYIYDGNPHPATGSVTGVNSENLGTPTFTYTPGGSSAPVNAGIYTVSGSFAGNTNYTSATSASSATITIGQSAQTISFDTIPDKYFGDPDFMVSPTASSGLPVSLSATSSPIAGLCTVTGFTIHIAGEGTCTITASQAGNGNYLPAMNVEQTFTITTLMTDVDVSIANPTTRATLPSSGPVTVSVPVTVSDVTNHGFTSFEFAVSYDQTKLTPTASSAVVVTGDVAFPYNGDIISNVVSPGSLAVQASGISPLAGSGRLLSLQFTATEIGCSAVTFGTPNTFLFNGNTNPVNVTTGQVCVAEDTTTTVTFESGPYVYRGTPFTATATVVGNRTGDTLTAPTVTYTGECTNVSVIGCTASATFAGDDTHITSTDSETIVITKAPLTVTANDQTRRYGEDNPVFDATIMGYVNGEMFGMSSGVTGAPVCTTTAISTSSVLGSPYPITCSLGTLSANNYSFTFVDGSLIIEKADQAITFAAIDDKLIDAPNFNASATGGDSGNPVTFTTSSSACSVSSSGEIDVLTYGVCAITAHQAGNDNYNAAPDVSQSFDVIPYVTNLNVSLPTTPASLYHGQSLAVPVSISETGLHAINSITFDLSYDSLRWDQATTFITGSTCGGAVSSSAVSGGVQVTITAPPSSYLSGSCSVVLNFVASNTGTSSFALSNFVYSSDTPTAHTGMATVTGSPYSVTVTNGNITGTITNFHNGLAVPDVLLSAAGLPPVSGSTNSLGVYDLSGFGDGSYTVTPSKTAETRTTATSNSSILSNDATMIQRHRVGLCPVATPLPTDPCPSPWNAKMQAAADVDQNGAIQSFDASLIQQFRAGIPNVVNQSGFWKFTDSSKTYADVWTPKTAEDYTALLLGDVDGSWSVPVAPLADKGGRTKADDKSFDTEYVKPQVADVAPMAVNVVLPTASLPTNATVTQEITVGDLSGQSVTSYDFDIVYDPAVVEPSLSLVNKQDTLSGNMSVLANVVAPGRLAVSATGINPLNGSGVLLKLIWRTVGNSGDSTAITFDPFIFNGGTPSATVVNGQITLSVTTAQQATVSGRITAPDSKGLNGAIVSITGANGQTASVRTNNFGVFTVNGLPIGQTYIISVKAKGYTFTPQTLNLLHDEENLEIAAQP